MSDRTWRSGLPAAYAAEKLPKLVDRWGRALGEQLRAMVPRAWPGVPATVFLGFTGFANRDENTGEATDPKRRPSFDELGYFQTERHRPFTRDRDAKYNAWVRLHDSPLVVELLGRPATLEPDAWRGEAGVLDQVAVGLANLRRHLGNARSKLPAELHPKDPASTWAVGLAFTAFSRGAGQLAKVLAPYAAELARVDEPLRWEAWERLVVVDLHAGARHIGTKPGRSGACYAIVRTRQKRDAGLEAARALGLPVDWYPLRDDAIDETIARCAYGV